MPKHSVPANAEGLTFGEFRQAALAFCSDPNERIRAGKALKTAWERGEDPCEWAAEFCRPKSA